METGLYYMRLVAGVGGVESLVSARVDLPEPAREILEWRKSVFVRRAEALAGSVVLTGEVQSRCLYSAGTPERVLCHRVEIGFVVPIPLPAAAPGMDVTVAEAFVAADASRPLATDPAGSIAAVLDQSLVWFSVRAVEPAFVPLHAPASPRRRRRKRPPAAKLAAALPAPPEAPPPPAELPPPPPAKDIWVHPSASVPTHSVT